MQPHLKITASDISPLVLLPGDPARVDIIGQRLNNFKILANNREFRVGVGEYKGRTVTVCSTGIGCPSTAIAVEELINVGAKVLIRVGTCGGAWRMDIPCGSVVVPSAAVRDEGTTIEYVPLGFPAVADMDVVRELSSCAKMKNIASYVGINRTHDAYYVSRQSGARWGEYLREDRWQDYDTPILSSDMETSALFVIASLRNVKAGAILAVNADPEPLKGEERVGVVMEKTEIDTKEIVSQVVDIALDAVVNCEKN